MSGWEVTSTGPAQMASWLCEPCDAGSGVQFTGPGEADQLRQEAADHLRLTGHQVSFARGTIEILNPLATQAPAPAAADLFPVVPPGQVEAEVAEDVRRLNLIADGHNLRAAEHDGYSHVGIPPRCPACRRPS
jgi:hypothetical protein